MISGDIGIVEAIVHIRPTPVKRRPSDCRSLEWIVGGVKPSDKLARELSLITSMKAACGDGSQPALSLRDAERSSLAQQPRRSAFGKCECQLLTIAVNQHRSRRLHHGRAMILIVSIRRHNSGPAKLQQAM